MDREALGAEAARCWLSLAPEERAETAVMAPTHEIRRQANEAGCARGSPGRVSCTAGRSSSTGWSTGASPGALAADLRSYEPGDTVVFHRDVFGCRANDVCTVMGRR